MHEPADLTAAALDEMARNGITISTDHGRIVREVLGDRQVSSPERYLRAAITKDPERHRPTTLPPTLAEYEAELARLVAAETTTGGNK